MPFGRDAIVLRDDGTPSDPRTDLEWLDWVAAGETRNWCRNDLLVDWLYEYGPAQGYTPDRDLPTFEAAFDLGRFLMQQGRLFERALLADLATRWEIVRIAERPDQARSLDAAIATWEAMRSGAPVIHAAVLRDPQLRLFGVVDLLLRNDVLAELCPDAFIGDPLELPVIGLSHGRHYRAVEVKFKTLDLLKSGDMTTAAGEVDTLAQAWIYNEALGRLQGYTPPSAFAVGRGWRTSQGERGDRVWERVARIRHDVFLRGRGTELRELVQQAAAWVRRVRTEGAEWRVLPIPSVPELWPNMKADDAGWHDAKAKIARELADLTLLPRVGIAERWRAHAAGITRWDDPALDAAVFGMNARETATLNAVLAVNRDGGEPLRPARLREGLWRMRAPVEAYVDFEFLQDLADDFSAFPRKGGQSLIFQIGCGTYRDGTWRFRQFTVSDLSLEAEAAMIESWLSYLRELSAAVVSDLREARLVHWSPAEQSNFERAYDNARSRHPDREWPPLPWFDLLDVVQPEPMVVRGAFSFSLKSIARAMKANGLIATDWGEGLADGAGAMAGAWNAAVEAKRRGVALGDTDTMREVARYNEVDCRVMAEILEHLRAEH
jgi:hypothetical protein